MSCPHSYRYFTLFYFLLIKLCRAVCFSLLASFLSPDVTGRGSSILCLASGVCMGINILLSNAAVLQYGSFFVPNLIYTIIIGPCIILAVMIGKWETLDRDAFAALYST